MGILAWTLGPPTVATALALLWVHWSSRPRRPVETHESLEAHARFRAALEAPARVPSRGRWRRKPST